MKFFFFSFSRKENIPSRLGGLPSTGSLLHQQFLIGDGAVGWACECLIRQRAAQNRERENNGSRATGARVPNRHGWLIRTRAIRHLSPPPFHHVIESCFFFDYKAPESLRARQEYRSRGCWSSFLPSRPRRLFSREFSWFLRLELEKTKKEFSGVSDRRRENEMHLRSVCVWWIW